MVSVVNFEANAVGESKLTVNDPDGEVDRVVTVVPVELTPRIKDVVES